MLRRRDALKGLSAIALGIATPLGTGCSVKEDVPPPSDPVFNHGIASGDPLPDAVILWTRIAATAPVTGRWEVAKDVAFASIVARGAFSTNAERDYTVKVDATGLEPGTTYYYRFIALGRTSLTGRTRTAPLDARRLRFAVVSCASLPHGYFHVYRTISERPDIDAVLHLGDYIYEYAEGDYGDVRESEPKHAVQTLADYRERYAQYRRDPDLQEAHRQHPFVCIWDDHELVDNAWRDGTTGDNPAVGPWAERRSAARTAYSEWIPIRDQQDGRIWRSLRYGTLAELIFLDTRLWGRDQQVAEDDPRRMDPARQLLGADQEAWLSERLRTSTARWKLVCQQVMMVEVPSWFRDDGWDDYPAARSRFFDILEKTPV
ncbi:MAG: phoD, partial [Labilithrix sp.]|nr:phoD [Labilithrix sp.]